MQQLPVSVTCRVLDLGPRDWLGRRSRRLRQPWRSRQKMLPRPWRAADLCTRVRKTSQPRLNAETSARYHRRAGLPCCAAGVILAVDCLSSIRLFAADTARTATCSCGLVGNARKGTRAFSPSCEGALMADFEFEGVATFPVAFSFSTGAESICCVSSRACRTFRQSQSVCF